jgi:fatty aldehyde-generating acyl-ACP reductase
MSAVSRPAFAALGHQESWDRIGALVRALRDPALEPLTQGQIREVVGWIPPRTVSRISVAASSDSAAVPGIYVDTFITPDELAARPTDRVLAKVRDGIAAAQREGVRLVTLGGFTSILLESMELQDDPGLALTTGNTLTTALIVKGVEHAARMLGRRMSDEHVLIIGATGDIGSACARCLNGRVRRLLLAARNPERLEREAILLRGGGWVETSPDVSALLAQATIVIAVTSAFEPCFALEDCTPDAIVCDAGYPKNIRVAAGATGRQRVFWGGMGVVGGGLRSVDGILERLYRFAVPNAAHGCVLEGAVLAMAGRFEAFSVGRGRITPARVEEMWELARKCGVSLAPLFDGAGAWPEEAAA